MFMSSLCVLNTKFTLFRNKWTFNNTLYTYNKLVMFKLEQVDNLQHYTCSL